MTTKKVLTAKKLLPCLIIDPKETGVTWAVILRSDGTFGIHDSTNYYDPFATNANCTEDLKAAATFDEAPFIAAFEKFQIDKERARLAAIQEKKEYEEKRVAELRKRIEGCETPGELSKEFGLEIVETAGHWSDLYEGRSGHAILIGNRKEFEIMELAKEIHGAEGDYGECRNRAGEHHHTFNRIWGGLEEYQEGLKTHFGGDNFFFKSQESDGDFFLERIKDADDMGDVIEIVKEYNELESGYYDCNGNLEMSEEELNDPDIAGYSYDVYQYNFAFQLSAKNEWKEEVEEELEEED